MATIPSSKVRSRDIGVFKGAQPGGQLQDIGAGARAIQKSGEQTQKAALQLAEMGAIEQRKEEGRLAQEAETDWRRNANEQWASQQALGPAEYVEKFPNYLKGVEDSRLNSAKNLPEASRELYEEKTQNHSTAIQLAGLNLKVSKERTAKDTAYLAEIEQFTTEAVTAPNPFGLQHNGAELSALQAANDLFDHRGGGTKPARKVFLEAQMTKFYERVIKGLLSKEEGALAVEYFEAKQRFIVGPVKAELRTKIRVGSITAEAQKEFDILTAPSAKVQTDAELLKAARAIEDPEVRKTTVAMVRAHLADLRLAAVTISKTARQTAFELAAGIGAPDGKPMLVSEMPFEIRVEISRTPGLAAEIDKDAIRRREGRPPESKPEVLGKAGRMLRDDPIKFLDQDFTKGEWVGLDPEDRKFMGTEQLKLTRKDATARAIELKELDKDARISRAKTATRSLVRQYRVKDAQLGSIEKAMTKEIERRTAAGEKLQDSDYQDIFTSLFLLQGEATGIRIPGFFGPDIELPDPDIKLFEAIVDRTDFKMKDFTSENRKLIEEMSTEAGVNPKDGAKLINRIIKQGGVPTADTVRQELVKELKKREK